MTLARFLERLLHDGQVAFDAPPAPEPAAPEAVRVLEQAYAVYRLQVAGPLVPFAAAAAGAAAEVVRQAAWLLLSHREAVAELVQRLELPPPLAPADHLSGDLVLRYVPQIYQRARARAPEDPLRQRLALLLRRWPLSGVLADLAEPPLASVEFGHPGLQQLYAERLARCPKPGWLPEGPGRQAVELACQECGKDLTLLLPVERSSAIPGEHSDRP